MAAPSVSALDAAARPYLDAMVASLASAGRDPSVVAAFGAVPRHRFVREFTGHAAGADRERARLEHFVVDASAPSSAALAALYDPRQALGLRSTAGRVTSTISAPDLLASMLELLSLHDGLRVLEIGTGSGYFAALLADLCGPAGQVTTLDIDPSLIEEARDSLRAAGFADVDVRCVDGAEGAPDRGPFDRIVASVSCADLSPRWVEQLAPGGYALLPMRHGTVDPLLRVESEGGRIAARAVGRSSFVAIQGIQAGATPWSAAGARAPLDLPTRERLPPDVREGLAGLDVMAAGFFIAVADRRAARMLALADGAGSGAAIRPNRGEVAFAGPSGGELRDDVLGHLRRWIELGRPSEPDYRIEFVPDQGSWPGAWVVERPSYREVLRLPDREGWVGSWR